MLPRLSGCGRLAACSALRAGRSLPQPDDRVLHRLRVGALEGCDHGRSPIVRAGTVAALTKLVTRTPRRESTRLACTCTCTTGAGPADASLPGLTASKRRSSTSSSSSAGARAGAAYDGGELAVGRQRATSFRCSICGAASAQRTPEK